MSLLTFFVCVAVEPTSVNTELQLLAPLPIRSIFRAMAYHWNAKDVEVEGLGDTQVHPRPGRYIVASPMSSLLSSPRESAPSNDEGSLVGRDLQKAVVRGINLLVSEEIVDVVFLDTVGMCSVGADGMHTQSSVAVVEDEIGRAHV